MSATFDPAPFDRHADKPAEAARRDAQTSEDLKAGLLGTFPASDPVSVAQPMPHRHPEHKAGLWSRITSLFH